MGKKFWQGGSLVFPLPSTLNIVLSFLFYPLIILRIQSSKFQSQINLVVFVINKKTNRGLSSLKLCSTFLRQRSLAFSRKHLQYIQPALCRHSVSLNLCEALVTFNKIHIEFWYFLIYPPLKCLQHPPHPFCQFYQFFKMKF